MDVVSNGNIAGGGKRQLWHGRNAQRRSGRRFRNIYPSTNPALKEDGLVRMTVCVLRAFSGFCGREHLGANFLKGMANPARCIAGSANGHKMELYSTCGVLF
jgi:hypothetical protein